MTVRLVVCDLDGTLVDKEKRVTPGSIAAVKRLQDAGVRFTVISARPRSGIAPILDALELDLPCAAFNGGLVFTRDGRELCHETIDPEVARGALALAADSPADVWVFAEDQWYASHDEGEHARRERLSANQEPVVRDNFSPLADRIDKITFVSDDPPVLAALQERITRAYKGRATVAMSQTYYLDVTALHANKGAGVAALADALGVPLDETAAIGDQANDVAMLERVALPIVMGNAPANMREGAAHVTRGNDADGVAHAIDTIILPRIGVPT